MHRTSFLIALLVILYLPLAALDYAHFPYSDGAEHGAAVRELARNFVHPSDPMLAGQPGTSPRFVPSILIMALAMRLTGLDVLTVLKLFLPLYFLLLLTAAALFAKEYFDDTDQSPWTVISLLFLWGTGWTGANAYMFSAILYTAYFPSLVAFSLALLALYFQLRFLKARSRHLFIAYVLLGSLTLVNHPPTGTFFFACSGLLFLEWRVPVRAAIGYFLAAVMSGLLVTLFWPYYDFFTSFFKVVSGNMSGADDYNLSRHYLYAKPLIRSGPALLGIPLALLFALQRRHLLPAGGFVLFGCLYGMGFLFKISLAERYIFFSICMLQLAFSRSCREWLVDFHSRTSLNLKTAAAWFLVLLLIAGAAMQGILVYREFILPAFTFSSDGRSISYASPNRMQRELGRYLKEGDTVLSDLYTSWSVPVYTGAKIIALYHNTPHVRDNRERIKSLETFFNTASSAEERKKIIEQYGVTHVLLNGRIGGKEIEPSIRKMGLQVVACNDTMCLFSIPPQL